MQYELDVVRLNNLIFLDALRDGASAVHLHAGVLGVQVLREVEGQSREAVPIPLSLWDDWKARPALMSEDWKSPIQLSFQGKLFFCTARLQSGFPHETIVLTFEEEAPTLVRASSAPI